MTKSTYIGKDRIKELPDREKPFPPDARLYGDHDDAYISDCYHYQENELAAYNAALASCRELLIMGNHGFVEGQTYQENIHYAVVPVKTYSSKWWEPDFGCSECCNGDRCDDPTHYDRRNCPYCKGTGRIKIPFYAIPIKQESQEDLWKEAISIILANREMRYNTLKGLDHLTISRKAL